jgi:hypothetical protein
VSSTRPLRNVALRGASGGGTDETPHLLLVIGGTTPKVERIGIPARRGAIGTPCAIGTYGIMDGAVAGAWPGAAGEGAASSAFCAEFAAGGCCGRQWFQARVNTGMARTVAAKTTAMSRDSFFRALLASALSQPLTKPSSRPSGVVEIRATFTENQPESVRTFSSSPG